jgi:cytochrome c-type biogenesis protein
VSGPGGFVLAFWAGLVSFLSPCTLPLLPGYLAYISGLGMEEVQARENTGTVVGAAALFVLGFSLVFVAIGATASYIGSMVHGYLPALERIAGVFIILMALVLIGLVQVPALYRDWRFQVSRDLGIWSAVPVGMAFAFGWAPCIGPVLGSIYALAMSEASVQRGALLLFVYALGLGIPFLVVALFAERAFESLGWFKRHFRAINLTGAGILLVMGVFLVAGRWMELLGPLVRWYGLHGPTI